MRKNTTQTCIAGEYYVLAELARRDAIASMTIRNSKGVDILVAPIGRETAYKIEVKTATRNPGKAKLWHDDELCFAWRMAKKHETLRDKSLIYVFVWLPEPAKQPRFFLVRSGEVAKYVRWEHGLWLKKKAIGSVKDTDMRLFRIPESLWEHHENNWDLLEVSSGRR